MHDYNGVLWAKPVAPYPTLMWGEIPATRWRIPPRPKAVVSCCRGEWFEKGEFYGSSWNKEEKANRTIFFYKPSCRYALAEKDTSPYQE